MRFHTSLQACLGRKRSGQICNNPQAYNLRVLEEDLRLCARCIRDRAEDWALVEYELRVSENRVTCLQKAALHEYQGRD